MEREIIIIILPLKKSIMNNRQHSTHSTSDTGGGKIEFDRISCNGYTLYVGEVQNMVNKEIPVGEIFQTFGTDKVIKADFEPVMNRCLVSVMESQFYAHTFGSNVVVITHRELRQMIDTYPGGKCVDGIICASYKNKGELSFVPYIYDWNSLPLLTKAIHAIIIAFIFNMGVYLVKDSATREYVLMGVMIFKDYFLDYVKTFM